MYDWFGEHPWITFILIYVLVTYVYNKVFRTRKLPLLKDLIVYIMLGVGSLLLLVFQIDARLPIIPSLAVAVAMMLIVRIRYWIAGRTNKQ
ncbi:YlaH-like family protein [Paenibacillus hamazuiensis]|uniref:YlaH-like family protein n=1 Tax=Paenibacillus hamazuiensis TaxID=2936508 RepID=UPI00200F84C8